jgi:hypothetical protein
MAGSLIKIQEVDASGSSTATLTGIDSTYDVYMVKVSFQRFATSNNVLRYRFTVGGSADTSLNYDSVYKLLRADTTFTNISSTNQDHLRGSVASTATGEAGNMLLYLFNFNNASEYSFVTQEGADFDPNTSSVIARTGGGILTVAQATDGITFYGSAGANFDSGTFTLYGLKK